MFSTIKRLFYFPVASYFRFFAAIRLRRWNPKIVVVTGSNGKTTLLHMLEAQIGDKAKYSHFANSSFGIPFDILDLHRKTLLKSEWISLFLKAALNAFIKPPKEKLYIVEADCDRPGEGKFLGEFLKPNIVLWVSTAKTHSMNFENLVKQGKFSTVEEGIAYEFGYFLEYARDMILINGDSELMKGQIKRTASKIISIKKNNLLKSYQVSKDGTAFKIQKNKDPKAPNTRDTLDTFDTYTFKYLLPEEVFYSIEMTKKLCELLDISFDQSFSKFLMPAGRGSIFQGIKEITIIDSSYNLSPGSLKAVLETFDKFPNKNKWVVVGDMLEMGESEKEEHDKLAETLIKYNFDKIILMGPRVSKYTYPKLLSLRAPAKQSQIIKFNEPKETLEYIMENIKGGETVLFKGARFMEWIIEDLLKNKGEVKLLPRREKIWEIRRKQWGL